jgi:hypothetical protein
LGMMFLLGWCCAPTKSSNNIRLSALHESGYGTKCECRRMTVTAALE